MIFSSINALTDTEAVCNGGPVDSFLSSFLLSESCKNKFVITQRTYNFEINALY